MHDYCRKCTNCSNLLKNESTRYFYSLAATRLVLLKFHNRLEKLTESICSISILYNHILKIIIRFA